MSIEFEKRFRNFDYKKIKKILKEEEYNKIGSFTFKIIKYGGTKSNQSIRVRDEGYQITFTIKSADKSGYELEYEVVVNNYVMINLMLEQLGLKKTFEMEKYREIYKSKDKKTEVIFDHFPGAEPYMEIESNTEEELYKSIKLFKLKEEPKFTIRDIYLEIYGIDKNILYDSATFKNAKELLEPYIKKNNKKFNDILENQFKKFHIKLSS
jgi:adenylate cyclase class IV